MRIMRVVAGLAVGLLCAGGAVAQENWQQYLDQVRIKKAIADTLTPQELEERRERLARWLAQRASIKPNVGADACPATTNETGALPFSVTGTTVGQVDNYDLPADTTAPTCAAAVTCTGTGPAGSLPRGAIYTGTGTGPDFAYRIRTNVACDLTVTIDPTSTQDLAAVMYPTTCSSALADCGCVSDAGVGGAAESIAMTTTANTDYFVTADGYSTGGTPPGPSGPFSFSVTSSTPGCTLVSGSSPSTDLSITKTDGVTSVAAGTTTSYTIAATNTGPTAAPASLVTDTFPAACTSVNWTCAATGGGTCTASGTGNINDTVNLPVGGTVTYTAACAINAAATGTLVNTATVGAPAGIIDSNGANNSATDTNTLTAAAAGNLTITPTTVAFGNVNTGASGTPSTVTLANTGTASLQVTTLTAPTAPFSLTGGTCGATPITIAAGANCTLIYNFSPTAAGPFTQTLTVTANAPGSGTITLTGTGVVAPGVLGTSTLNVTFGNQAVGSTSQRTLTISNTGTGPLQVTGISAVVAPFTRTGGGTCGTTPFTLAAGASCTVIYSYVPTTAGPSTQTVTVTSDGGTATVTISGTGVVAIPLNTLSTVSGVLLLGLLTLGTFVVVRRR